MKIVGKFLWFKELLPNGMSPYWERYSQISSSSNTRFCRGVGWVVFVNSGGLADRWSFYADALRLAGREAPRAARGFGRHGSLALNRLLTMVDKSSSSVWKLCTGGPSSVRPVRTLRMACAERYADRTADSHEARAAAGFSSSNNNGARALHMCHCT